MGKISVIIPVYKVERYLRQCIDSVLAQTYTNLEVILVDDGSPDNCGIICDEYAAKDKRVKVIHKENGGVSSARNAGIDVATGDWLMFVDGDDFVSPCFAEYLKRAQVSCNADIAFCGYQEFCDESQVKLIPGCFEEQEVLCYSADEARRQIFGSWYKPNATNKLFRRSFFYELRFPDVTRAEDLWLTDRLLFRVQTVVGMKHCQLYFYRMHEASAVHTITLHGTLDELRVRLEDYQLFAEAGYEDTARKFAEQTENVFLDSAIALRGTKEMRQLQSYTRRLVKEIWLPQADCLGRKLELCLLYISTNSWVVMKLAIQKVFKITPYN